MIYTSAMAEGAAELAKFHISKACPSTYKVFFAGARGSHLSHTSGSALERHPWALSASRRCNPCSAGRKREIVRDRKMSNPVVLITGALSGIGRAAAVAFAKKGAKVVVAGRRE